MLKHFLRIVPVIILLALSSTAFSGPPFITDDPEPVDYQHHELYFGGLYSKSSSAGSGSEFAQVPFMEFNYGIAPETQIHVITPGEFAREKQGGEANYGYGDTELGLKYRFFKGTDTLPEIATFPLLEVPTGDHSLGLGNGKIQVFLPIWMQKSFGKWTTYGGGGFFYNPARDARSFWRTGIVIQRDLSEQLTLGVEFLHETPAAPGQGGHTAFNVGGYYNFTDNYHLLFSAGRDIDGPNQFMTYLAFQFTW